jgi:hypothetical protein
VNARLRSFVAIGAIALCTLGATTACSGGKKKVAATVAPTTATSATAKPAPAPAAKPKPRPTPKPVNPLTGGAPTKGPVIAVKIDDTAPGRPQRNIDQANIVYVEEVEAGLDRLIAVYDTSKPVVGYVRSIRLSDPELLLQYGKITLAASGGSHPSLRTLKASKLPSWINDNHAPYFVRAPHPGDHGYINLTLNLAKVSQKIKTAGARNVGFVWNAKPAGLSALPKANRLTTRVGVQAIQFVYNAKTRRYIRVIGGVEQKAADGKYISTPNVIVEQCKITNTRYLDVNRNPQQFTHSIGRGVLRLFRNGRVYAGTWSRKSLDSPTILRDSKGRQITLMPGGAWVVLTRPKVPVSTK